MRLVVSTALGVLVALSLGASEAPKTEKPKNEEAKPTASTPTAATAAPATPPVRQDPPKPSPALEKWVELCVQNLLSEDPAVKNGAVAALRVAGPAGQARLEKAAKGSDPKLAEVAKRLLAGNQRQEHLAETREQKTEDRSTQLYGLKLTDEQRPKVSKIFGDYRTKQDEITSSARKGELPSEQAKAKLAALREDVDKQLATVLTAEQLKQYKETMQATKQETKPQEPVKR